jgi:uncharacterized membrane protein
MSVVADWDDGDSIESSSIAAGVNDDDQVVGLC